MTDTTNTTAAVVAPGEAPSAALPSETTTNAGKRLAELIERVLTGEHIAITRGVGGRRPVVLVNSAWYDRQQNLADGLMHSLVQDGRPVTRADYLATVHERANTNTTNPIQLDEVEAVFVAELLDELAALYGAADPVGGLARDCARMINLRLGRD